MIDFTSKNPKTAASISNSKFPKFGSPSKKSDQMQTIAIWKTFLHRHPHRRILSSFQVEIEAFNLSDKNLMKIHKNIFKVPFNLDLKGVCNNAKVDLV